MLVIISYLCALVPLVFGTIVFFAWLLTRQPIFELLGMYNMGAGIILFWTGLISISSSKNRSSFWKKKFVVILLLLNVPIAITYIVIFFTIISRATFEIVNQSHVALDSVIMQGPINRVALDPIASGEQVKTYFYPGGDGALKILVSSGNQKAKAFIDGYITTLPKDRHDAKIIIKPNLEIKVIHKEGVQRWGEHKNY